MIDFSNFPFSQATNTNDRTILVDSLAIHMTAACNINEEVLADELLNRIGYLEETMECNYQELTAIHLKSDELSLLSERKEKIVRHINELVRLYNTKEKIAELQTKDDAKKLKKTLFLIMNHTLKNGIIQEIEEVEYSLPAKIYSEDQLLMQQSIEEAGPAFVDLGKVGREFVIKEVLRQLDGCATIEAIQHHTKLLEQTVEALKTIKEPQEFIEQLECLPIPSFHVLGEERKSRVAEALLETKEWDGIISLNGMIGHIDKTIMRKELGVKKNKSDENMLFVLDGKAAITLDIESVKDGKIQLD